MPNLKNIEKQAAKLLGLTRQTIGKTQARKDFFPLIDALSSDGLAVEITDHEKPVAVLLSYQNYVALTAKLCMLANASSKPHSPDLIGSVQITTRDLGAASERIARKFKTSLKDTAGSL